MGNQKQYRWYQDIESGQWKLIDKETYDKIRNLSLVEAMINPDGKREGTIMVGSTAAQEENNFQHLWEVKEFPENKTTNGLVTYFTPSYALGVDKYGFPDNKNETPEP